MPLSKIDLHIHSEYSDGENSLQDIFDLIRKNNIHFFSITDHNFISPNIENIAIQAKKNNTKFYQGIEISTYDAKNNISAHILGYSKSFDINRINDSLISVINGYNDRAKQIIKKLNELHPEIDLDFEFLLQNGKSPFVSRNLLSNELVKFYKTKIGKEVSIKEILKEVFIKEQDPLWMIGPKKAVELIIECGGIAILAHPGRILSYLAKNSWLENLVHAGLNGLEVFYPSHSELEKVTLLSLSQKYNLSVTAGNDWHGSFYTPHKNIGCKINELLLQKFIQSINTTAIEKPKKKRENLTL